MRELYAILKIEMYGHRPYNDTTDRERIEAIEAEVQTVLDKYKAYLMFEVDSQ